MKEVIELFKWIATTQGVAWALLVAVGVAYWLEVQDRKKNTVPMKLYETQQERCNKILENQVESAGAISKLTELVRFALQGKER